MSDVRFVERRGYLTLCLEAQGITRTYLRRTDGIRDGGLEIHSHYSISIILTFTFEFKTCFKPVM